MSGHEREKARLEELDRARGDTLARENAQAGQLQPQTAPLEQFNQIISQLQTTVRQQQLKAEQNIQQTLQQAATILADTQRIDTLSSQVLAIQQALNQQGPTNNPDFFEAALKTMGTTVQEQLYQSDQQVAQALSQSVSALARSQDAMSDSQAFYQLTQTLAQCEKLLNEWKSSSGQTVH